MCNFYVSFLEKTLFVKWPNLLFDFNSLRVLWLHIVQHYFRAY